MTPYEPAIQCHPPAADYGPVIHLPDWYLGDRSGLWCIECERYIGTRGSRDGDTCRDCLAALRETDAGLAEAEMREGK